MPEITANDAKTCFACEHCQKLATDEIYRKAERRGNRLAIHCHHFNETRDARCPCMLNKALTMRDRS